MSRQTGGSVEEYNLAPLVVRSLSPADGKLLGSLMYAAYKGTIDYRDESPQDFEQELEETFVGRYGEMVWNASFIVISAAAVSSSIAVSTTLVTLHEKLGPLLAFTSTHPSYQNKGLAGTLIRKSLAALKSENIGTLTLVVTPGNDSAIALYKKLGFIVNVDV